MLLAGKNRAVTARSKASDGPSRSAARDGANVAIQLLDDEAAPPRGRRGAGHVRQACCAGTCPPADVRLYCQVVRMLGAAPTGSFEHPALSRGWPFWT